MFILNENALVLGGDDATLLGSLSPVLCIGHVQGRIKRTVLVINADILVSSMTEHL